jgi:hypothetical protein
MFLSRFYFDDILIYADITHFKKIFDSNQIENMKIYFNQLGWDLNIRNNKYGKKIYFNGICGNLIRQNYIKTIDSLISIGYNESYLLEQKRVYLSKPADIYKDQMNFDILGKYLESFSIDFKTFYDNHIIAKLDLHKESASKLENQDYSLFVNGISFVLSFPLPIDDSLLFEIYNYFSNELTYTSDYDIIPVPSKERIIINSNEMINTIDVKVILRFSPESRFSLSLHTIPKDLSKCKIYKGINQIAVSVFRYIKANQIEKADQLLVNAEKDSLNDPRKHHKLFELHRLLDKYRELKKNKDILDSLPEDKFWVYKAKLRRDILLAEKFLNKKDFFDLIATSEMDFRSLELKLSKFIVKIDPDRSDVLFPCYSKPYLPSI